MAKARFALEAVFAGKGDALILHHGTDDEPRWTLIDGGHTKIYQDYLLRRLGEIARDHDHGFLLDPVILSHADEDHLHGLLEMFRHIADKQASSLGRFPATINNLWMNDFVDILGPGTDDELVTASLAQAATASSGASILPSSIASEREMRAVLASTRQGIQLRKLANKAELALTLNSLSNQQLIVADPNGAAAPPVDLGANAELKLIAPEQAEIDKLRSRWNSDMKKIKKAHDKKAKATAFTDGSAHNLASLVFLVTQKVGNSKRTMLLTGDARGDKLVDSLKRQRMLRDGQLKVDLFKLPHHGSFSNVTRATFATIVAKNYVISSNGEHGNPEIDTLNALKLGRRDRTRSKYKVFLTVPEAAFTELDENSESSKVRKKRETLRLMHEWIQTEKPDECEIVYRVPDERGTIANLRNVVV